MGTAPSGITSPFGVTSSASASRGFRGLHPHDPVNARVHGKKLHHRLLVVMGIAMAFRADEQINRIVRRADNVVKPADFRVGAFEPTPIKIAMGLPEQDDRGRRTRDEKIGHVQARANDPRRILFGICRQTRFPNWRQMW